MRSKWKVWVTAKSQVKAQSVYDSVIMQMGVTSLDVSIEPYPKTEGFVVSFGLELRSKRWDNCVVEVIALGQQVGYQWILSGDIERYPSGWSNNPRVVGVKAVEWTLLRDKT